MRLPSSFSPRRGEREKRGVAEKEKENYNKDTELRFEENAIGRERERER